MRRFQRHVVLVVVACIVAGCYSKRGSQDALTVDTGGAPVQVITPVGGDAAKPEIVIISQDELDRLFSLTWFANDRATVASSLNQGFDPKAIKDFAWLQCIQWETRVFFKDAGVKWITVNGESVMDLPVRSEEFHRTIRVIDEYHFAFFDGKYWLVFRAADWEFRHYDPPK